MDERSFEISYGSTETTSQEELPEKDVGLFCCDGLG